MLQFFNNALMLGKTSESELSEHLYDLIYELNAICPSVLLAVLPQLEFKLKVSDTIFSLSVSKKKSTYVIARWSLSSSYKNFIVAHYSKSIKGINTKHLILMRHEKMQFQDKGHK